MYCNAYCTELNVTYDRPQIHFSPWYAIAFERVHTREEAGRGRGIVTANINRRYAVSGAALIRRSRGPSLCTELCGIFAIFATPRLLCRCRFVVKWLPQLRAEKRKNRGKGDWLEGLSLSIFKFSACCQKLCKSTREIEIFSQQDFNRSNRIFYLKIIVNGETNDNLVNEI